MEGLWYLDCIMYATIIAWYINRGFKCENKRQNTNERKKGYQPRWLKELEREITEIRKQISQCVAEINRLRTGGRITRRTKRNRKKMEDLTRENLSINSITKLIMKSKARLRRLAKRRKKKLRFEEARKMNNRFRNNQSSVYNEFRDIISAQEDEEFPSYKKLEKDRKYFNNETEVETFWKSLWQKSDTGNPNATWLKEIEKLFTDLIPELNTEDLIVTDKILENAIKKKRNWSSPGPDLIANFWLKKLAVIRRNMKNIFQGLINSNIELLYWFCSGRAGLLEKPGGWLFNNTRPITCTNNVYKWFTSVLQYFSKTHLKQNGMMQIDQRGAKEGCSGTVQNLMIDNMVLKDAHENRKNLACAWVDVKKAYDSLSHSWIKRMMEIHRFPLKLQQVMKKIVDKWNIVLVIPLKNKDVETKLINLTNGVLQGDPISADLYTLSKNPISWDLRRNNGYTVSKPVSAKITHGLFIDDLKTYNATVTEQRIVLSNAKDQMKDAGLEWNVSKSKALIIKRGKVDTSQEYLELHDGTRMECLKTEDSYKFLGLPECELHRIDNVVEKQKKAVKQRANVIWTSPLSDYNKVIATNAFVFSTAEYFMWSEKMNLTDLREMDSSLRDVMNRNKAKYKLQINSILYLPRNKGGRGIKNLETTYKQLKIKSALKLVTEKEPRMEIVRAFEENRSRTGKSSIIKDAIGFAKHDLDSELIILQDTFTFKYRKGEEEISTQDIAKVKKTLKDIIHVKVKQETVSASWQGVILKIREEDTELIKDECFSWLGKWKDCPTRIINNLHSIYLQIIPTLSFVNYRTGNKNDPMLCRLCKRSKETVKHILSNCDYFLNTAFKRRHDKSLQHILFKYLNNKGFIAKCPPWYSSINIKPMYENEEATITWDIPEYSGYETNDNTRPPRPDGKIMLHKEKKIFVLEISIPWIENRTVKYDEKETKYRNIVQSLKVDYPQHEVKQLSFIMDCLGGYSVKLKENLKMLGFNNSERDVILYGMQKIVLTEASSIMDRFKIMTKSSE